MTAAGGGSLRGALLRWLLLPTLVLLPLDAWWIYREGVAVADAAYDRSLLLSARTLAERLRVDGGRLVLDLPYAALDMTENDLGGELYYRVGGTRGELIAGFDDFPPLPEGLPLSTAYPTLVRFYEARYRDRPVRVAALHQPISEEGLTGVALVQVAETLESRAALSQRILVATLLRQGLLLGAAVLLIFVAVRRGLRPLQRMRDDLEGRGVQDLTPLDERNAPAETRAFVAALNRYIGRLVELVELRKRFIANAAHQLRTPIAVLKTQIGVARRERDEPALRGIVEAMDGTAQNAARLAHQLLSLTRAEHGVAERGERVAMAPLARQVCLELAPRAAESGIDLGLEAADDPPLVVAGDAVLLQEMLANLVDNATRYAGRGASVTVRVAPSDAGGCVIEVEDDGPGIPVGEHEHVLKRFYRVPGQTAPGSGLGLAIVNEIVIQHGGRLALHDAPLRGLRVRIELPVTPA
jgi:two-component system, OmpR family, sensor histidine kinase TctE